MGPARKRSAPAVDVDVDVDGVPVVLDVDVIAVAVVDVVDHAPVQLASLGTSWQVLARLGTWVHSKLMLLMLLLVLMSFFVDDY